MYIICLYMWAFKQKWPGMFENGNLLLYVQESRDIF